MINKELRKLNRRELIDIIYQMKKNEQQMQEQITALQTELEEKRLRLSQAGSIAEAALSVSNVFSAAQEAADLYLREIACMKAETEKECARILDAAKQDSSEAQPAPQVQEAAPETTRQRDPSKLRKLSRQIRRWTK